MLLGEALSENEDMSSRWCTFAYLAGQNSEGTLEVGRFARRLRSKYLSRRRSKATSITAQEIKQEPVMSSGLSIEGLEKLGEGTSGAAFLVKNTLDGSLYCVKSVPVDTDDETLLSQISNEAKIHSSMSHSAIVRYCYSWLDKSGPDVQFCLLMELCDCDLWDSLENSAPSASERMEWSRQLAGAVQEIHQNGAIHRDFNPWNVFVTSKRRLKIGDFGLSVFCDRGSELSGWEEAGAVPLDSSAVDSLY